MEIKNIERKSRFKGEITYKGIFKLFRNEVKRSNKILDVGAGNGFLLKKIYEQFGKKAVGIDLKPESDLVIKGDITSIPFESNYFDAVICTDVIEHLTDKTLNLGLNEICRVMKPLGKVIFTTLLEEDLEALACKCENCGQVFHRVGHIQTFTKEELINRFENTGLKIDKIITTHMGAYSTYPFIIIPIKFLKLEFFLPNIFRKILNKDIIISCHKD